MLHMVAFQIDNDIVLKGTPQALLELQSVVESLTCTYENDLMMPEEIPPNVAVINKIRLEVGRGKLMVSRQGSTLVISGKGVREYSVLRDFLFAASRIPYENHEWEHIHLPNHVVYPDYVSKDSREVIIKAMF